MTPGPLFDAMTTVCPHMFAISETPYDPFVINPGFEWYSTIVDC